MVQNIPPRFRESAFRRYENVIATVVNSFPQVVRVLPGAYALSPVTFACRFRDAMRSLSVHRWPTQDINMVRFDEVHEAIVVAERHGQLYIGGRNEVKNYFTEPLVIPEQTQAEQEITVPSTGREMLVMLAHSRLLSAPIEVIGGMTIDEANQLAEMYDITITPTKKGFIIL